MEGFLAQLQDVQIAIVVTSVKPVPIQVTQCQSFLEVLILTIAYQKYSYLDHRYPIGLAFIHDIGLAFIILTFDPMVHAWSMFSRSIF